MEREYYRLEEAAALLNANIDRNYSTRDLIHFAAYRELPLYILARKFVVHETFLRNDGEFFEGFSEDELVQVHPRCLLDLDHGADDARVELTAYEVCKPDDEAVNIGPMPLPWRTGQDTGLWELNTGHVIRELRRKDAIYWPRYLSTKELIEAAENGSLHDLLSHFSTALMPLSKGMKCEKEMYLSRQEIIEAVENGTISSLVEKYPAPTPVTVDECIMVIHSFDFKKLSESLSSETEAKNSEPISDNSTINKTERRYMLTLILGMAMDAYGYNPAAPKNNATGGKNGIAAHLKDRGFDITDDTVRKYLDEAKKLLPPQAQK